MECNLAWFLAHWQGYGHDNLTFDLLGWSPMIIIAGPKTEPWGTPTSIGIYTFWHHIRVLV